MGDPSLVIPNDDPDCPCELAEPDGVPAGATVIVGSVPGLPQAAIALFASCPHHGGIVRARRREMLRAFSIGTDLPS